MNKPLSILSGLTLASTIYATNQQPNVIFILVDDLGYHQLGCYGSTYYETPNMDVLAGEGMRFTNAYAAAALSSPTRAALLSGKYPARLNLTDWLNGYAEPAGMDLTSPNWTKGLSEEEIRLPTLMKSAGYVTSLIGKWHVSKFMGAFDEVMRFDGPKSTSECDSDCHRVAEYTTAAIDFISRYKNQPFFLYLSHNSIHTPETEESSLVDKYRAKPGTIEKGMLNPVQAAMLERLDYQTGRLMQEIKKLGLEENTIIILTADNGQLTTQEKIGPSPLRGGKVTYWEGGMREPLIVKWKNKIQAGAVSDAQVITHDFMPTIAALCGINSEHLNNIDGKSFADNLLVDPNSPIDRPYLCWHYPHYHPEAQFIGAIRKGDWKLIENFDNSLYYKPGSFELYNLGNDPKESTNLAYTMPLKTAELYDDLQTWRSEMKAQMPLCKKEVVGKNHFQFNSANTPAKIDLFHEQTNIQEGLRFDGTGTYLTVSPNAIMKYWINIEAAGAYEFKLLCKNTSSSQATLSFSINNKQYNLAVNPSSGWETISVTLNALDAGIYNASLTNNSNATIHADKFAISNQPITLIHDGLASETNFYTANAITFEDGEEINYIDITGNPAHQLQTPIITTNPYKNNINPTNKCLYARSNQNEASGIPGWFANNILITLKDTIDIYESNKYLHMMHWKERVLNTWLVYGSIDGVNYEELGRGICPEAGKWFDIVVDVSSKLQRIKHIRIHLDGNWGGVPAPRYYAPTNFYYDEIVFSNIFAPRVQITTDNVNITTKNNLTVYPNPVLNQLHTKSESPLTHIEVYNYAGIKVMSKSLNKDTNSSVNIDYLPSGVYFIRAKDINHNQFTEKIIKQ